MCDSGEITSKPKTLRNGMDYVEPKKYPPDYSNIPSVRDWQMSPFGNERYDLDEIQRLEKKGVKFQAQLEALKKHLSEVKDVAGGAQKVGEGCAKCSEMENRLAKALVGRMYLPPEKQKCPPRYLYQPYGPPSVSAPSGHESSQSSNTYPTPSLMPPRCLTCSTPEKLPPVEYPEHFILNKCENSLAGYTYVPYGPTPDIKIHPDVYKPYGPSPLRTVFAHLY